MTQPSNINFLSSFGFRLVIARLPEVEYFLQTINIPGMNLGSANRGTPFANPVPYPGDLTFNPLQVTFKVDEELANYMSIWNWMTSLGFPESFDQYAEIAHRNEYIQGFGPGEVFSNMKILILDNKHTPIFHVDFLDCFPSTIGDLTFRTTDTSVQYITCDVTFAYTLYTITQL